MKATRAGFPGNWGHFVSFILVLASWDAVHAAPDGRIVIDSITKIADPKIEDGGVDVVFRVDGVEPPVVTFTIIDPALAPPGTLVSKVVEMKGAAPHTFSWNGKDEQGKPVALGAYVLKISAEGVRPVEEKIHVIRLSIQEIRAIESGHDVKDEWQMVYFKKGVDGVGNSIYDFTSTPACGEYRMMKPDYPDGSPRPVPKPHTDLESPVLGLIHKFETSIERWLLGC